MGNVDSYRTFLNVEGDSIFELLMQHCRSKLKMMDIDTFELSMLANSFAMYSQMAKLCNEEGFRNKHDQVRPEYTVMRNEYQNILKHSAKFGLNPADRMKIFKGVKEKKKNPTEGLE